MSLTPGGFYKKVREKRGNPPRVTANPPRVNSNPPRVNFPIKENGNHKYCMTTVIEMVQVSFYF
jgi:hypothetical protein